VDKTVRVTRNAVGQVRRLNAAVVVNHKVSTDAKGKTKSEPLSTEELDKLTALVQESIGFSKERGDSVKVINAPFKAAVAPKEDDTPLYRQPWLLDLLRGAAMPAALALVALVAVFGFIRPALKAAATPVVPAKGGQLDVVADDPAPVPLQLEAPRMQEQLKTARELAKENPVAVANIVRGWVNKDV
jgi:flagellar M-ring protein FliF